MAKGYIVGAQNIHTLDDKGDAILQKTYCIKKNFVANDGSEITKYCAQNSHPAIVSAGVSNLAQMELEWRRSLKSSCSGKKMICIAYRMR